MFNIKQTPIQRLRLFVEWAKAQGLCTGESNFESQCNLQHRYITNNLSTGKGNIGTEMLGRIIRVYPQLNLVWLCTGNGCMIVGKESANIDYKQAYELAMQQISVLNNIIKKQQL